MAYSLLNWFAYQNQCKWWAKQIWSPYILKNVAKMTNYLPKMGQDATFARTLNGHNSVIFYLILTFDYTKMLSSLRQIPKLFLLSFIYFSFGKYLSLTQMLNKRAKIGDSWFDTNFSMRGEKYVPLILLIIQMRNKPAYVLWLNCAIFDRVFNSTG